MERLLPNYFHRVTFEIDALQLAGNVMGTGTNFRWVGELRAVAEKGYGTTMTGLILRDARAEMNDGVLTASAGQFNANALSGIWGESERCHGIRHSSQEPKRCDEPRVSPQLKQAT
jgi:hypothetical protein